MCCSHIANNKHDSASLPPSLVFTSSILSIQGHFKGAQHDLSGELLSSKVPAHHILETDGTQRLGLHGIARDAHLPSWVRNSIANLSIVLDAEGVLTSECKRRAKEMDDAYTGGGDVFSAVDLTAASDE